MNSAKLPSVGLRNRRGASYHGVALNGSYDFDVRMVAHGLTPHFVRELGFGQSAMSTALQEVSSR
jgi:lipoate-protein ligase B